MLRSSSICTSFMYNYLTRDKNATDGNGTLLDEKYQKLKCLSDTLQKYGGALSKIAQLMSLRDSDNSVFSDCKPFSKKQTIEYFKSFIENTDMPITNVDFDVYKSGSVGQVHKAEYNGRPIVFKVQYVGLYKQTIEDMNMVEKIATYLYSFIDTKDALAEVKTKMLDELNYKLESTNQQMMASLCADNDSIEIPDIIPELCTDKVLCMSYVPGRSLSEFINDSTQDERDKIGMSLVKFVFENLYKNGILYSDVHYGNFVVKDDSTLCVLDFGCLHRLSDDILENIRDLHISIRNKDKDGFYLVVTKMGIIKDTISPESKKYIYEHFQLLLEPWTSEEFEFTDKWLRSVIQEDAELMKEWTLPHDMAYFNKIPAGSYYVFTRLKLKGRFREVFDNIFKSVKDSNLSLDQLTI